MAVCKRSTLQPGMDTPEVLWFTDGHYCYAIFGVGPYIADYPEKASCLCIIQGWCPQYVTVLSLYLTFHVRCSALQPTEWSWWGRWETFTSTNFGIIQCIGQETFMGWLWYCWWHHGELFLPCINVNVKILQPFTYSRLIAPDILHQVIKGTFKDHLVTWVEEYINFINTPVEASKTLADIDRR